MSKLRVQVKAATHAESGRVPQLTITSHGLTLRLPDTCNGAGRRGCFRWAAQLFAGRRCCEGSRDVRWLTQACAHLTLLSHAAARSTRGALCESHSLFPRLDIRVKNGLHAQCTYDAECEADANLQGNILRPCARVSIQSTYQPRRGLKSDSIFRLHAQPKCCAAQLPTGWLLELATSFATHVALN
jgi:hypothetical protein